MRSRRGFTLVETLVALAVTAVLLAALATAVPATLRANAVATARLDQRLPPGELPLQSVKKGP
jgi:prepilin-type N-terminal cleavage/methylation domain-containing protein